MEIQFVIPENLKSEVLGKIKPASAERAYLLNIENELVEKVNKTAEQLQIADVIAKVVGSAARGTWLSGTHDIDIFISFPEETSREELEARGMAIAKEVAKSAERFEDRHAEHPYLNLSYKGLDVDLVPCFRVSSAARIKSAVDRTPFHNEFVKEHINGREDEVLLLKQFMRGGKVYGSELKTQGFSGYLSELLVIHYGSFEDVIRKASSWKPGVLIDIKKHAEIEHPDPLVVVDPTDPKRNVAAALSLDKFCIFIAHCREFLKNPDLSFFFPEPPEPVEDQEILEKLESRKGDQLAVVFKTPAVVEDVLFPQLYKMEQSAVALLTEYDFSVIKSGVWAGKNETLLMLELFSKNLPNVKKHTGPPVWVQSHAEKFRDKYRKAEGVFASYIEGGKYVAEIQRKYPEADGLLKARLGTCSLGKHITKSIKEGFYILVNAEICKIEDPDFRVFLRGWM